MQKTLTLRLVSDMYDAGVVPGDLTESQDRPFIPWPGTKGEAISRIANEMKELPALPDSGDICWFSAE
ncbi:hypothetical protein ACTWJ8_33015 [Streptomyces sp. SDT5-1]|uniref:hypothetical protein n=1 Tax=Streptomyces sp. SDT5-1 TaxID=3406418 RepID=UPI003FD1021C